MSARRCLVTFAVLAAAGSAWALDAELKRRSKDADPAVRADSARALAQEGSSDAARVIAELLADRDPGVRDAAVLACDGLKDAEAVKSLAAAARGGDVLTRRNLAEALGRTKNWAAVEALESLAGSDQPAAVRADALDALANFAGEPKAASVVKWGAADRDPAVRAAAVEAAGRIGGDGASALLKKALGDADDGVRCVAQASLRRFAPVPALGALVGSSMDPSWRVRAQCVEDAAALREKAAVDVLVELVGDKVTRVAAAAHRALQSLSGKDLGRDPELWVGWWEANRETWTVAAAASRDAPDDPKRTKANYHGLDVATDAAVFVADLSGSMKEPAGGAEGRTRWTVAAEELRKALGALPDSFVTNLVFFQQEPRAAFTKPQALSKAARDKAEAFIESGSPQHTGDLLGGILMALDGDGADTIIVLSDGSPSAGEMTDRTRVREAVRRRNRTKKCVIDSIGFGAKKAVERAFLEGLARDSGGRCLFRGDGAK
jgi:HEAT repeat protein